MQRLSSGRTLPCLSTSPCSDLTCGHHPIRFLLRFSRWTSWPKSEMCTLVSPWTLLATCMVVFASDPELVGTPHHHIRRCSDLCLSSSQWMPNTNRSLVIPGSYVLLLVGTIYTGILVALILLAWPADKDVSDMKPRHAALVSMPRKRRRYSVCSTRRRR